MDALGYDFFCQLHKNLSQNCGSDGHFEVLTGRNLNGFKSYDPNAKNANEIGMKMGKTAILDYFSFLFVQVMICFTQAITKLR